MNRRIEIDVSINARTARFMLAGLLVLALPMKLGADSLTLNVAYPAPTGIFNSLTTLGNGTGTNTSYLNKGGSPVLGVTPGGDAIINLGAPAAQTATAPSTGHVGIGTTSPSAKLDVNGYIRAMDNSSALPLTPASGKGLELYAYNGGGYIQGYDRGGGAALPLHINDSGSSTVTIGNGNAVGGSTVFIDVAPSNQIYGLYVNGDAYKSSGGTSWQVWSDGRLKDIRGNFTAGLKEIRTLTPVRYRYKKDNPLGLPSDEEHIGLVAQEVRKVIPEAVAPGPKGYLTLRPDPVIWAMLNAIKEQRKELEALRAELAATPAP